MIIPKQKGERIYEKINIGYTINLGTMCVVELVVVN